MGRLSWPAYSDAQTQSSGSRLNALHDPHTEALASERSQGRHQAPTTPHGYPIGSRRSFMPCLALDRRSAGWTCREQRSCDRHRVPPRTWRHLVCAWRVALSTTRGTLLELAFTFTRSKICGEA
ncbi:hypothetical protein M8818_001510 [Zalaria obscura]|uniref:Uncharacterized protein n=1 Tax=Zalaria obscura TaxID=2024903 RepID=A0ACC3SJZ5_9PEZI